MFILTIKMGDGSNSSPADWTVVQQFNSLEDAYKYAASINTTPTITISISQVEQ